MSEEKNRNILLIIIAIITILFCGFSYIKNNNKIENNKNIRSIDICNFMLKINNKNLPERLIIDKKYYKDIKCIYEDDNFIFIEFIKENK